MPVRIRVKDFQSIRDAEVVIEGLSVVTGPNNSGKTALLRAVRGVFTNPPAGPLVRQGAAFLSVELTFDDGTQILWEKGWEKPGQKGAGINRYSINGVEIQAVGRGAPPEIAALGVREIQAASDRVWPQVAEQFDGTLFLINRSGSAVAEALSDVEKVGKLTTALKLSEKDRRSADSELKVRRKDVEDFENTLKKYDGLDLVSAAVVSVQKTRQTVLEKAREVQVARVLLQKLQEAQGEVEKLKLFEVGVPKVSGALQQLADLREAQGLCKRLSNAREEASKYPGLEVSLPGSEVALELQATLSSTRSLQGQLQKVQGELSDLADLNLPDLPDFGRAQKLAQAVGLIKGLYKKYEAAQDGVEDASKDEAVAGSCLEGFQVEVAQLLGDRGFCPTCNSVHEAGHHV